MLQVRGEFEFSLLEFFSQQSDHLVFPHFFDGVVIEISIFDPGIFGKRKSAYGGGEMDMDVSFQVSAEGMQRQINSGDEAFFPG